ncbi:MAG: hypothetical protein DDT23_01239 [candidate division WS2 bacterium]|nr:hypothetical protein [Candidatus Lithacetigena glycinireducens]
MAYIPKKTYLSLVQKGWIPKRASAETIIDFGRMRRYVYMTFEGHELFSTRMEASQAEKLLLSAKKENRGGERNDIRNL